MSRYSNLATGQKVHHFKECKNKQVMWGKECKLINNRYYALAWTHAYGLTKEKLNNIRVYNNNNNNNNNNNFKARMNGCLCVRQMVSKTVIKYSLKTCIIQTYHSYYDLTLLLLLLLLLLSGLLLYIGLRVVHSRFWIDPGTLLFSYHQTDFR